MKIKMNNIWKILFKKHELPRGTLKILILLIILVGIIIFQLIEKSISFLFDEPTVFAALSTLFLGIVSMIQNTTLSKINKNTRSDNLIINSNFDFNIENKLQISAGDAYETKGKKEYLSRYIQITLFLLNIGKCKLNSYCIEEIKMICMYKGNLDFKAFLPKEKDYVLISKKYEEESLKELYGVSFATSISNDAFDEICDSTGITLQIKISFRNSFNVVSTELIVFENLDSNFIKSLKGSFCSNIVVFPPQIYYLTSFIDKTSKENLKVNQVYWK